MAFQHLFGRSLCGFYSKLPGFDTIAVSDDLSEKYVKQNIWKFCFYENNYKNFMPPVFFYSHLENNSVIFGQNIYVYDKRDSFLSHTIIISDKKEMDLIYNNFDIISAYNKFTAEITNNISDLDLKNVCSNDKYIYKDILFSYLKLDLNNIKALLYYTVMTVKQKKQVFIKLNASLENYSKSAKVLMSFICDVLPFDILKSLSYITYSPTAILSTFFNIIFIDKDVDSKINGYLLDFTKPFVFKETSLYDFHAVNIYCSNIALIEQHKKISNYNYYKSLINTIAFNKNILYTTKESYFKCLCLFFDLINFDEYKINYELCIKNFSECKNNYLNKYELNFNISMLNYLFYKNNKLFGELFFLYDFKEKYFDLIIKNKTNSLKSYFYLNGIKNYFPDFVFEEEYSLEDLVSFIEDEDK